MDYHIKEEGSFKYVETGGSGDVILLLHGLFGAMGNFEGILDHFKHTHNVVLPILPIFELPITKLSVTGLVEYVISFVEAKGYKKVHVLGNSLGGHIALLYALESADKIQSIILTGSSGLFENTMGSSFPKRGDYEFIKRKAEATFYDPAVATKELIDDIYEVINNRNKAIRIVATAKSAIRHNLGEKLHTITAPTLLVWGKQDTITPPFVGEKFHELIASSQLILMDKCGHAPMMERPEAFNTVLESFLNEIVEKNVSI